MAARSTLSLHTDHLLGYFADLTYSYRFGPRQHDLVMVRLRDTHTGEWLHEDFYFPASCAMPPQKMDSVTLNLVTLDDGQPALKITTAHFLQSVRLELKSHLAEDNYFHLAPGSERLIRLRNKTETAQPVKGYLEALNLLEPIKVR